MFRRVILGVFVVVFLAVVPATAAEPVSELLEKGIYTEETLGDLDAAIEVYEEILADAAANRRFVAEAQYRLGQCLLKKGDKDAAIAAFERVIKEFADQEELVAKAREYVPGEQELKLEPAPWADREALELTTKLGGGLKIGAIIVSVRPDKLDGREVWQFNVGRYMAVNGPNRGISGVTADRSDFHPITSYMRHTMLGNVQAEYTSDEVKIHTIEADGEESDKSLELDKVYYDNEQAFHLFRQLPLAEGYKAEVPISATFGSGLMDLEVEVIGRETIKVPAGEFECYGLNLKPVQQKFWISTDENRYVVKVEAGNVDMELTSIRHNEPGTPVDYTDDTLGFSLTMPTEWYLVEISESEDQSAMLRMITDPEAVADSMLIVKRTEDLDDEHQESPRAWAEANVAGTAKVLKDYKVRPDSWREWSLAGQDAASYIADYVTGERKMVSYQTYIVGESTSASFQIGVEADRFDDFRKSIDSIIETCRVK